MHSGSNVSFAFKCIQLQLVKKLAVNFHKISSFISHHSVSFSSLFNSSKLLVFLRILCRRLIMKKRCPSISCGILQSFVSIILTTLFLVSILDVAYYTGFALLLPQPKTIFPAILSIISNSVVSFFPLFQVTCFSFFRS